MARLESLLRQIRSGLHWLQACYDHYYAQPMARFGQLRLAISLITMKALHLPLLDAAPRPQAGLDDQHQTRLAELKVGLWRLSVELHMFSRAELIAHLLRLRYDLRDACIALEDLATHIASGKRSIHGARLNNALRLERLAL